MWVETPPTPRSPSSTSLAWVARLTNDGALVVVDNTFATPYLQRPLALGADVVVHSATKYLGGHSDVVGGFVATDDPDVAERVGFLQNAVGAVPSPFDCYLVLRGVKTLAVRMERHCANARAVAEHARRPPRGRRACCTRASPTIPATTSRARQMRDFGGMVSFLAAGGEDAALASSPARGCSPWPSRSAASSR